jgi:hypothetical protein
MIRHASKHASEVRQTSRQAGKEKVKKTLRHKSRQQIPHKRLAKYGWPFSDIMCHQSIRKL